MHKIITIPLMIVLSIVLAIFAFFGLLELMVKGLIAIV